jgi:hypothetical protein
MAAVAAFGVALFAAVAWWEKHRAVTLGKEIDELEIHCP